MSSTLSLPLVTIAIPTCNRANGYLRHALASAVGQNYPNLAILVSDNASSDDTEQLVRSFADSRVRYVRHPVNIGGNNNFNFCIQEARGEYFLLLHDDDLIDKDFVEVCMHAAGSSPHAGLIRTGMRRIDADGQVVAESINRAGGLSRLDFYRAWFAGQTPMHLCSTMFNTRHLREAGGLNFGHQIFQDVMAEFKVEARHGRVDVRGVHASFRKHPLSATLTHNTKEWCDDSQSLLDAMCEFVIEDRDVLRREGRRFFVRHNVDLARRIASPVARLQAYLIIFREFNYPVGVFISRVFPVRLAIRVIQGGRRRLHAALKQGRFVRRKPFA